jgi:hypothetical protein
MFFYRSKLVKSWSLYDPGYYIHDAKPLKTMVLKELFFLCIKRIIFGATDCYVRT